MWRERLLALWPSIRGNLIPLALGFVGMIFLGYGLISSTNKTPEKDIVFESFDSAQDKTENSEILVDVGGAVVAPGVYSLNPDARVKDALIAAQGFSQDADRDWISKNLNLAGKLTDSAKVYIPKIGENYRPSQTAGTVTQSSLININSASLSELESLPGIGPVTAQKIVDNRPYNQIDDLTSKKVVGNSVFEKIKERISTY